MRRHAYGLLVLEKARQKGGRGVLGVGVSGSASSSQGLQTP